MKVPVSSTEVSEFAGREVASWMILSVCIPVRHEAINNGGKLSNESSFFRFYIPSISYRPLIHRGA